MKLSIDLNNCTEEELDDAFSQMVSRLSRTQLEDLMLHLIDAMGTDDPRLRQTDNNNHETGALYHFLAG